MDYGVSNTEGQVSLEEISRILTFAQQKLISILDTAALYGDAEERLGHHPLDRFKVITKTPHISELLEVDEKSEAVLHSFSRSLRRLKQQSIYGLLVHRADALLEDGGDVLISALQALKAEGQVRKIGVSIYNSEQLARLLDLFLPDIVQLPINVLDQRLVQDGSIAKLKKDGVEIHARSALLQGLLVMPIRDLPAYFAPWRDHLKSWHDHCADQSVSPLQAALTYVCDVQAIDCCLIGVQSLTQLQECLAGLDSGPRFDASDLAADDPALTNPSNWILS